MTRIETERNASVLLASAHLRVNTVACRTRRSEEHIWNRT